jgi:tRNA (guanine10-N2)-dimethyltransferase
MTFFILGAQPALSIAELKAVLGKNAQIAASSNEVVLVDDHELDVARLQHRLAGIVKTGQIIGELESWHEEDAGDLIASYAAGAADTGKISFGISVYDLGNKPKTAGIRRDTKRVGMQVKKHLKDTGRPVRFVTSREDTLSSVIVQTNDLLTSGGEFVIMPASDKIYLGQTAAVQNFESWSRRDFGRPARDAKSGMLPPKLARMMINLSGAELSKASLLDPFCGSGTVLMEAALMGVQELIGSDIDPKAISATKKNLDWIAKEEQLDVPPTELFACDVAAIASKIEDPVDLIVAEGYLGPPLKGRETKDQMKRNIDQLVALYETTLRELRAVIKPTGTAVIAFPIFNITNAWLKLPIQKLASENGWDIQPPSPLLYSRPKQYVGREIFVLKPRP